MIVYCRDSRKAMDESLTLSQSVFVHEVIALYRECRSTMKYEFPSFLISILYHMFGDESASSISSKRVHCKVVIECLEEMRSIIIGSLASRMYPEHRLDVFKLIQMAIVLRGHQWFEGQCNGMNSEKLFLFVLSSASNEMRIHLQSDSKATASWKQWRFSTVDTTLNILDKLVSYIISDDEAIDSWITSFAPQTMHAMQQHIHQAIGALFFFVTELKMAVFEQYNDDGLAAMEREKNDGESHLKSTGKMDDILDEDTLQLLDRVMYGITMYLNHDQQSFGDEFCSILPFVLCQFGTQYLGVISNVVSKMLTQQSAESEDEDKKLKDMIMDQMYFNDFIFEIVIGECLDAMAMKLCGGIQLDEERLFELENEFLSIALMVHDVFAIHCSKFVDGLLQKESRLKVLIQIIALIAPRNDKQQLVIPLLVVVVKAINMTADDRLKGIQQYIDSLVQIGNLCQRQQHSWFDDLHLGLKQLSS